MGTSLSYAGIISFQTPEDFSSLGEFKNFSDMGNCPFLLLLELSSLAFPALWYIFICIYRPSTITRNLSIVHFSACYSNEGLLYIENILKI